MLAAFYWLLIRPQRRNMQAHRDLMAALGVGDEVLTAGGIYGKILSIDDGVVELEAAPGVTLRMARTAISRKLSPESQGLPPESRGLPEVET